MSRAFEVIALALDPRTAHDELAGEVERLAQMLPGSRRPVIVGPVGVAGYDHVPVAVGLPSRTATATPRARVVRVLLANRESRTAWRVLSRHQAAMNRLVNADLVAVVDTLGHRSGWVLSRRHGVRAVTGERTVRFAIRSWAPAAGAGSE
jgi:hypothetical protein